MDGGRRKKEEDNGEMSRMIQFPLFLLPLLHFPRVLFVFFSFAGKILIAYLPVCDRGAISYSIFDISAAALVHSRPR